jgi:hypothetical protein
MVSLNEVINGKKPIEAAILEAITEARTTCTENGNNSANCAVAWDIVEELQAEKARRDNWEAKSKLFLSLATCAISAKSIACLCNS